MTTTVFLNIAIEIFCSVLSLVFVVCILVGDNLNIRSNRAFIMVLLSNVVLMLSDALAFYSIGKTEPHFFVFNFIGNFLTFQFSYVILMCFSNYVVTYLESKISVTRTPLYMVYGVCGLAIVLTFLSLLNDMYFIIDENNVYHRQSMYWLSQVLGMIAILINAVLIIKYHRHLNRMEKFALATYIILPLIAVVIQTLVYGFVSVYIASTTAMVIIYIGMQAQYSRILKEKELQLVESRISVMLSQIQPHFLYNTLNTIENLCYQDGNQAAELVRNFSGYLRENMDSLTQKELVHFDRELEHIQIYLDIEKLRFEERLHVVYDFAVTDFELPILTVQPLVENAVRYGVTKRLSGGTVTIATRKIDGNVQITVSDDGVGFDPVQILKRDERSHIGMENVRERLRSQCMGSLTVESEKGKGTVCTIIIPAKGDNRA